MRPRRFGLTWIDLLVIASCSLAFAAVLFPHPRRPPAGPPSQQELQSVANELGVTADQLRHAAEVVPPPARGARLSPLQRDEQRVALAEVLNVPVDRLDQVFRRHHPAPPRD